MSLALIVGCGADEEPQQVETPAETAVKAPKPEEYMRDGEFLAKLDKQDDKRKQLLSERYKIQRKLMKKASDLQAQMPGAGEAELVAALEQDPEWVSLKNRMKDLVDAAEDNRAETLDIVRERLTR